MDPAAVVVPGTISYIGYLSIVRAATYIKVYCKRNLIKLPDQTPVSVLRAIRPTNKN